MTTRVINPTVTATNINKYIGFVTHNDCISGKRKPKNPTTTEENVPTNVQYLHVGAVDGSRWRKPDMVAVEKNILN